MFCCMWSSIQQKRENRWHLEDCYVCDFWKKVIPRSPPRLTLSCFYSFFCGPSFDRILEARPSITTLRSFYATRKKKKIPIILKCDAEERSSKEIIIYAAVIFSTHYCTPSPHDNATRTTTEQIYPIVPCPNKIGVPQ